MTETLFALIPLTLLAMISPGPDFFIIVKNSLRYTRTSALATAVGIAAAVCIHMIYCLLGVGLVISKSILLFNLIKLLGAGYLIFLGVKGLRSKSTVTINIEAEKQRIHAPKKAFTEGFLCNLLNPKATIFFLSVFTQLIKPNTPLNEQLLYATVITTMGLFYWSFVVLVIQQKQIQKAFTKSQILIDKLLGGILVALGAKVALSD